MNEFYNDLKNIVGKENLERDVNLKKFLTFKVNSVAKTFVKVYNKKTLKKVLLFLTDKHINYICLGGGSNILFKRKIVKEVIVCFYQGYSKIYNKNGSYYLSAFAGCKISNLIQKCKTKGFSCLEWAVGIPATLGGAVIMNMGIKDKQISDYIYSVTYYHDGKIKTSKASNLFSYRNSWFKLQKCVIISCVLLLEKKDKEIIQNEIMEYLNKKILTQPLGEYTCGSIFKNGLAYKSAVLIEKAGLKGLQIGGAVVSQKHSNFIVNKGNATGKDILKLIKIIKKEIFKRYKIRLEEELIIY